MNHANSKSSSQTCILNITVNNAEKVIYSNTDETLLECLEKANHDIHYHCRDGYCGACRVTLNKGEVNYFKGEPLAYVGKDEILPCCCKPTKSIEITVL